MRIWLGCRSRTSGVMDYLRVLLVAFWGRVSARPTTLPRKSSPSANRAAGLVNALCASCPRSSGDGATPHGPRAARLTRALLHQSSHRVGIDVVPERLNASESSSSTGTYVANRSGCRAPEPRSRGSSETTTRRCSKRGARLSIIDRLLVTAKPERTGMSSSRENTQVSRVDVGRGASIDWTNSR